MEIGLLSIVGSVRRTLRGQRPIYKFASHVYHVLQFTGDALAIKFRSPATKLFAFTPKFLRSIQPAGYRSQFGQDYVLHSYHLAPPAEGRFIDVGANHPETISNSYFFDKTLNYRGVAIDAQDFSAEYASLRPGTLFLRALISGKSGEQVEFGTVAGREGWEHTLSGRVDKLTLDGKDITVKTEVLQSKTLDEVSAKVLDGQADILFIDVEGAEEDVLLTLDSTSRLPKVICVENAGRFSQRWRIRQILNSKGFKFWGRIWIADDIFVSRQA